MSTSFRSCRRAYAVRASVAWVALWCVAAWGAGAGEPVYFNLTDTGAPPAGTQTVSPWKVVTLAPEYGGHWVVAADLDDDGQVEIVSAENFNRGDVHYTSAAAAQELDGSVIWRWGDPAIGRKIWHHDVALQIVDWDGDGTKEVVLATKGFLVELDGRTGRERRRIPIVEDATDCLVFCRLSSKHGPMDVLVKDRYRRIWAYDHSGRLLWTVQLPGGYRTAHQSRPIDLDGDGRDEIMAGYALLGPDGSVRWVFHSHKVKQERGHLDCCRVVRHGRTSTEFRLALTCCGANNLAMIDGAGRILWERSGHHFESIDVGEVFPDHPGPELLVDIDHQPFGRSPLWVLSEHGQLLAQIITNYSRHHLLIDWTGDGINEICVADNGAVYDRKGRRVATLLTPGAPTGVELGTAPARSILKGDMTGDGVADLMIATPQKLFIFRNSSGSRPAGRVQLGTELNFTLY